MKKLLLILLFSFGLSSNSFAERIYCSYVNDYGSVTLIDFWESPTRDKKWLVNNSQPFWEASYESEASLVLQSYSKFGFTSAYINKQNKKLIITYIDGRGDASFYNSGKCKFE